MYQYLLCAYQQWCDGNPESSVQDDGELFVELIYKVVGYDKTELRKFLICQPWFHSKLKEDPNDQTTY